MKILKKDGGPASKVWGYFFIETKKWFTIVLLRFEDGARDAYHTHAFNAYSWVLKGKLVEEVINEKGEFEGENTYTPSFWPIWTPRECFHKVSSEGRTWALSFRGPWVDYWREFLPNGNKFITLTHGRKIV